MSKQYLGRLPEPSDYPQYSDDSDELAFVFPLFWGYRYIDYDYLQYTKSSFWSARSLIANADIVDKGIPIYFFIEDVLADEAQYLLDGGVDASKILTFHAEDINPDLGTFVGKKLEVLRSDVLSRYKHLAVWDADLFVCRNPALDGPPLSTDFLKVDGLGALLSKAPVHWTDIPYWHHYWTIDNHEYGSDAWSRACYEKSIGKINELYPEFGLDLESEYPVVWGGVLSFPNPLPDGFVEFAMRLYPEINDEQLVLALWHKRTGQPIHNLDISLKLNVEHWELMRQYPEPFYTHFGDTREYEEQWEPIWRKDIGL